VSGLLNDPSKSFNFDDDASTHTQNTLQYSVNQITTFRSTFTQDLNTFVDCGVPAIGLWKRKIDNMDRDEAIARLRESELPVSTFLHVGGFTGSNGMDFSEALDDAYESLFLAKACGAKTVIIAPGSRGHQFTLSHERRLVSEAIRELAFAAADLNLNLSLQPMRKEYSRRWSFLHSIDDMQRLMDRVNHPRVNMVLDTFQLADEPELLERLGGLVSRIGVVALSDAGKTPTSNNDRYLPGCGELPLLQIIQALSVNGYDGFFDLQIWSQKLWTEDAQFVLEECNSAMKAMTVSSTKATVTG
jgi:sugar phosphate isomerase/epimerase